MVTGDSLRVVFFGTPEFAVPTLDALLASPCDVVGVVTQPDRPRGRGQRTTASPVKTAALAAGKRVLQPTSVKDAAFLSELSGLAPDLGVVAAYGQILTERALSIPRLGMINVHASILPRYRGAAPVHRAVINGETETGVTIMRVVKALDAGPMLATARRPITADETSDDVERDLAEIGAQLLLATIPGLSEGRVAEVPQDDSAATYAPRLAKDDGRIDWTWPAERIHNLIRGLHPWPHAATFLGSQRFILHRSKPVRDPARAVPGAILEALGDRLVVAAGAGRVEIVEIQPEGKRPMSVREFLAGHPLTAGSIFHASP
jgi:methionyl-tRNA formyltransferase